MVMVVDLYDRQRRRQGRRHVPRHHHGPQEPPNIDILCMKLIGMDSRTSSRWSQTYMTDDAGARDADMSPVTILSPRDPPI